MDDGEELSLEALAKALLSFSAEGREMFLSKIPTGVRGLVEEEMVALAEEGLAPQPATVNDSASRDSQAARTIQSKTVISEPEISVGPEVIGKVPLPPTVIREVDECESAASDGDALEKPKTGIQLVKLHARGSVGEVFAAYDNQLSREVAVKRIRPELSPSEQRVRRFIREAEITAKLQHPGIVPIYNLTVSKEASNYSMPFVSGSTLLQLIQKAHSELGNNPSRERWMQKVRPLLTHFIAVCNAIDYAHSRQVLHRDLKPANIIVGTQGQTMVLDWGCAKDINDPDSIFEEEDEPFIEDDALASIFGMDKTRTNSRMTIAGSVMGTLEYMSPEQASGNAKRVGYHSDIFGLGATMFHLLTGEVAFEYQTTDESSVEEAIESVKRGKFRSIEEFSTSVPPALAAICRRATAIDPKDRYATAGDLGRDIDAALAGDKVEAYREPLVAQSVRFVKRYRTLFAALLGTLIVGFISLALFSLMVSQQKEALFYKNNELDYLNGRLENSVEVEQELTAAAVVREEAATQQLYETHMLLASEASSEPGGIGWMQQLVDRWKGPEFESNRGWEWSHLESLGRREFWKVDLDVTASQIIFNRDSPNAKVFDAGRRFVVEIDADGKQVLDRVKLPGGVTCVDFNRDQSLMAIGFRSGIVKVLKTSDGDSEPVEFKKLTSAVTDVCWNIGGDMLATCDASGEMVVWQWYDRNVVGSGKDVLDMPSKRLLCWSYDGKEVFWTTGSEVRGLTISMDEARVVAEDGWIVNPSWSHEGKLLSYIGPENVVVVVDPKSKKTTRFKGHQLFVESLNWHPSKHFLLSSSSDGTVRIWNADTEKQTQLLLGHSGHVYSAAWNPAGDKVVSGGLPEDPLRVWDVSNLGRDAFERELQDYPAFAWHPSGKQLVVAENADIVIQNDRGESRWIRSSESRPVEIHGIDLDPTGGKIACVSKTGRIWTVDWKTGDVIKVVDEGSDANLFPEITSKGVAWSKDGKFLAGIGAGGRVRIWDATTGVDVGGKIPRHKKALVLAWGPENNDKQSQLVFAGTDDNVFVFDAVDGKVISRIKQPGWKTGLDWSPDGTLLAIANRRSISIRELEESGASPLVATCEGPSSMVWDLSWSSSQDRIAALTEDGKVCLWNSKNWAYSGKFNLHDRAPYSIRWSPDGKRLVSTARFGRILFQEKR